MPLNSTNVETLAARVWPQQTKSQTLRLVVLALAGAALITLGAKITVPFYPVPMTLQTFAVTLVGAAYGARLGAETVLLYLAEGALGLPVFSQTPPQPAGIAYMIGPTGGFLLGFIGVAFLVGWFAERGADRSFWRMGAVMLVANLAIFIPGMLWLGVAVPSIGFSAKLLAAGFYPFILGDLVKVTLAASLITAGTFILRRRA